jgi:DNA repair exonuclease SbcCD ATPase subunit
MEQLSAKKKELSTNRGQLAQAQQETKRALDKLRDMEAAWKQAKERASDLQIEIAQQKSLVEKLEAERPAAPAAAATGGGALTPELYNQAITPLTVLAASADMLLLSPSLEPSLRETATEMKEQSQVLMDLIKRFADPSRTG